MFVVAQVKAFAHVAKEMLEWEKGRVFHPSERRLDDARASSCAFTSTLWHCSPTIPAGIWTQSIGLPAIFMPVQFMNTDTKSCTAHVIKRL